MAVAGRQVPAGPQPACLYVTASASQTVSACAVNEVFSWSMSGGRNIHAISNGRRGGRPLEIFSGGAQPPRTRLPLYILVL